MEFFVSDSIRYSRCRYLAFLEVCGNLEYGISGERPQIGGEKSPFSRF